MKLFKKDNILAFLLGAVIFGSIGVVSAYSILANDIGYTPNDTTWEVDNVKNAIDDLYTKKFLSSLKNYEIVASQGSTSTRKNVSISYAAQKDGIAIAIIFGYSAYGTNYVNTAITTTSNNIIHPKIAGSVDRNKYAFAVYELHAGDIINVSSEQTNGETNLNSACGLILFKSYDN